MRKRAWGAVWPKFRAAAGRLLRPGDGVVVGVSGGRDSVALAHALRLYSQRTPLRLHLAHVDHGLRPHSARDGEFVVETARKWGLPVTVLKVRVVGRGGLEHAARKARYRALASVARRLGFKKVAVAHHADDQAESVLLHLLRGTDPAGLGGMPEIRPLQAGGGDSLIRPFLGLSRGEIELYLSAHGLSWREDPTNRSNRLLRNWVRRKLIPLIETRQPRLRLRLAELAARVRSGSAAISRLRRA